MKFLTALSDAVFGLPTVAVIICMGIYYSLSLGFIQLKAKTMMKVFKQSLKGSAFSACATSLAATVGTGSVVGVAMAISLGGAGAIFWMWVSAFFGMALAYAEGVLSIKFRVKTKDGYQGGMMYSMEQGLGSRPMGATYALFATLASLGMGVMAQTNSASVSLESEFSLDPKICCIVLAILMAFCVFSKSETVGKICSLGVPILAASYILLMLGVIAVNYKSLPEAISSIFAGAFGIRPIIGGGVGYTVKVALTQGIRRGVFSNEAGLGTTAAIHAGAKNITPREQGYMNMFEVFVDTFVICTLTALAILSSGADISSSGVDMLISACETAFGSLSGGLIAVCVAGFAVATAVGWSQIGKSAFLYVTKGKFSGIYNIIYIVCAFLGAITSLEAVFTLSDIFNGLMALPCLTALMLLSSHVKREAQSLPVEPKPLTPRSVSSSSSDRHISGNITGVTTS